jgi:hypothetical protein
MPVLHTVEESIGKTATREGGRCSFDLSSRVAIRANMAFIVQLPVIRNNQIAVSQAD